MTLSAKKKLAALAVELAAKSREQRDQMWRDFRNGKRLKTHG